jgi:hypothetical protein
MKITIKFLNDVRFLVEANYVRNRDDMSKDETEKTVEVLQQLDKLEYDLLKDEDE